MKIELPLTDGISLQMAEGSGGSKPYSTTRLQKGLVLYCDAQDLSEEAVGFGVPIVKRGLQTFFPGEVELISKEGSSPYTFTARYKLNLEEKIGRSGGTAMNNPWLYAGKNYAAGMIRRLPILRKLLTGTSSLLRSTLSLNTTYEPGNFSTHVTLSYSIDPGEGRVAIELVEKDESSNGNSEIIVMNEQGAHYFDQYQSEGGEIMQEDEIGCWDVVSAPSAAFISRQQRVAFSLPQVKGARLYRGRELVGSRLAWSGFGYTFSPELERFGYSITITRQS